jgi:hypothetical protein
MLIKSGMKILSVFSRRLARSVLEGLVECEVFLQSLQIAHT